MPFVSRDAGGAITAIFDRPSEQAAEELPADHPEISLFLGRTEADAESLARTDAGMGRVVEDLIEILIEKRVLLLTDLPQAVLEKISRRRALRGAFFEFEGLLSADKDKII